MKPRYSEPKLGKKPAILPSLKALLKPGLSLFSSRDLLITWLQTIRRNNIFQIHIQSVASRHYVVVIHRLDERLHPRLFRRLLRRVLSDHLLRVLRDAGDEAVAVRAVTSAFVEGADDHGFPAGESAVEDDYGLVWLQKLHHFRWDCCVGRKCLFLYSPLQIP